MITNNTKKRRGLKLLEKNDDRQKICNIDFRSNFNDFQKSIIEQYVHQILIKFFYYRDIMIYLDENKLIVFATISNVKINSLYFSEINDSINNDIQ